MGEMVNLGATAPAGTKGDINVNMGASDDKTLSGNDWRYSKVDDHGDRQYWDGASWQPIPAKWSDKPIGTKLLGFGIWKEGGVNHTQYGSLTWPDPIPDWTADQRATANSTMKTWISNRDLERQVRSAARRLREHEPDLLPLRGQARRRQLH